MELIINNPCPQKRFRNPGETRETRGRKGALDTTLCVLRLQPDKLFLFTEIEIVLPPDLKLKLGSLPYRHSQRLRSRLQNREIGPDAYLIGHFGKHRRFAAWWGQTLQNLIGDLAYHDALAYL